MNDLPHDAVIVDTASSPRCCVLWLHGLGADGHDFEPIVSELPLPPDLSIRFIFPHAPIRPVTINGGMHMRAWYDFFSLDPGAGEDYTQVGETARQVQQWLNSLRADFDRLILGGFSQGGAMALLAGLSQDSVADAVFGLSTYLPDPEKAGMPLKPNLDSVPIFMAHGSFDPVIPVHYGRQTLERLRSNNAAIQWHEYPMQHSVCIDEIRDLGQWLGRQLT
ncbi:phospholipase/carboxylesterase [Ectothiorhodosinus mongolicus]|uniref:Phospholipase/carboxylesterase n=1 Tax=Ectothiorhodosinus mongolicus TaxID=233100 RepID=A0A1R3VWZ5_9GAMM|nr:carboxylesterase [Ectothiorhodosinus mongolicus]ULX57019.1 carboxylesterase [Ectothiorhodosinus mongolicus]SIT69495.1 phospholipase/carboxylesterase [Ectothiorhodosinus mongolicus]